MKREDGVVRGHLYRRWECCGHIWEGLLSDRYPERQLWYPTCPDCGETDEEMYKRKLARDRKKNQA